MLIAPFNRCFSVMDGKFVRDDNLVDIPTAENPRWQSISLASTGTYTYKNKTIKVFALSFKVSLHSFFYIYQSDVSFSRSLL